MEVKFIGTGSGKASVNRFHSSILFSSDKYNLLIDAGDGISKALLNRGIDFNKINGILFTHFHPDHFTGIASLVVQMKMNQRKNPLEIFIDKNSQRFLEDFFYNSYLFAFKLGFEFIYKNVEENIKLSAADDLKLTARRNTHLDEYKRYDKKNQLNFASFSFLISIGDKNIFYSGDIGSGKDLKLFDEFNIDYFITEITHIDLDEISSLALSGNYNKILLTHISDEDEEDLSRLISKLSPDQRKKVYAAEDGFTVNV